MKPRQYMTGIHPGSMEAGTQEGWEATYPPWCTGKAYSPVYTYHGVHRVGRVVGIPGWWVSLGGHIGRHIGRFMRVLASFPLFHRSFKRVLASLLHF